MDRIRGGYIGIPEMPKCTHQEGCPLDPPALPGHRHRTKGGTLREKSGLTHLDTLEKSRGEFSSMPNETHLKRLREITGKRGINAVAAEMKKLEGENG